MMIGPQADFWYPVSPRQFAWTGQFYSENTTAGIIAWRGQAPRLIGNIADRAALGGTTRINDWNEYLEDTIAGGGQGGAREKLDDVEGALAPPGFAGLDGGVYGFA